MTDFIFHDNSAFMRSPVPCGDYLLFQAGEMLCREDTAFSEHNQICFEITFGVGGSGGSGTKDTEHIEKNDCFFSLAGENHVMSTGRAEPLRFHFLGFNPQPGTAGEKYVSIIKNRLSQANHRVVSIPAIHGLIDAILQEIKDSDFISYDVIGLLISEILIKIIRAYSPNQKHNISGEITSESMLVYHIISYIDANIYKIKNLYEIEPVFNYSYSYLSAVFKKIMSVSLNDYFKKLRMDEAKKLLEQGDMSVTGISCELNYSSVHTFSRSFKNYFGFCPGSVKSRSKMTL